MRKIVGLAIAVNTINYGTFLQAFATQTAIRQLGYETEIINIESVAKEVSKARKKYFISRVLSYSEVKSYFPTVLSLIQKKINPTYRTYYLQREKSFSQFRDKYFEMAPICDSWTGLQERCRGYSSVVVGSDQLWRPANIAGNFYTLSFVPEDINKISYATSFGMGSIRKNQKECAAAFLQRIRYLSCREASGIRIIRELTGRDAALVCDPTLLLTKTDWEQNIPQQPIVSGRYILTYLLGSQGLPREFAKNLSRRTGCKVVGVLHGAGYIWHDEKNVEECPAAIDPLDFLNLVKNAEYVCTDSFHGCVFSCIMEKNFYAFKRFSDKDAMSTNSRVTNLLKIVSLEDRLVSGCDIQEIIPIDYGTVYESVAEFRLKSLSFLQNALKAESQVEQ